MARTINYSIPEAERIAICLKCRLSRCAGNTSPRCPLYKEQLRRWREQGKQRRDYFREYKARKVAERKAVQFNSTQKS